jgi:hypothetical protein
MAESCHRPVRITCSNWEVLNRHRSLKCPDGRLLRPDAATETNSAACKAYAQSKGPTRTKTTPVAILCSFIAIRNHTNDLTIDDFLFDTFVESHLIPNHLPRTLDQVRWNQASRTDSGAHAAAQVVSCRVTIPDERSPQDIPKLFH